MSDITWTAELASTPAMTLREHYTGLVIAGLCANPGGPIQANPLSAWGFANCGPDDVAALAVGIADAVVAALKEVNE